MRRMRTGTNPWQKAELRAEVSRLSRRLRTNRIGLVQRMSLNGNQFSADVASKPKFTVLNCRTRNTISLNTFLSICTLRNKLYGELRSRSQINRADDIISGCIIPRSVSFATRKPNATGTFFIPLEPDFRSVDVR